MIDYNIIHGDRRQKFKSLDFNFGEQELLEIKEGNKLHFKRQSIDVTKEQLPKLRINLENDIIMKKRQSESSLNRGKAYFHNYIDTLQKSYMSEEDDKKVY